MDMKWIGWILILFVIGILNLLVGIKDLRSYLSRNSAIESASHLRAFKAMVRKQMYQALFQLAVLGLMGILGLAGILVGKLSILEFLLFLFLNGIVFILGVVCKTVEKKARSFAVKDEELAREYEHVCRSWIKSPFPEF